MSDGIHRGASEGGLAELVRGGDQRGLSEFYAAHAGVAHAYARRLCGPTAADDAMAGALATAVARVRAGDRAPLGGLVEDAIRQEALTRARDADESSARGWRRRPRPECQRTPALLAARAAGRLSKEDAAHLERHLEHCPSCRELARRAREAEQAFAQPSAAPGGAAQDAALAAMAEEAGGPAPEPVAAPILAVDVPPEPIAEPEAAGAAEEEIPAQAEEVVAEEPVPADAQETVPAARAQARSGGTFARLGAALRRLNAPPVIPPPAAGASQETPSEPVAPVEPEPELVAAVGPEPEPVAAVEPEPEPVAAVEPEPEPVAAVEPEPVAAEPTEPKPPRRLVFARVRRGRGSEPGVPEVAAQPAPEPQHEPPAPEPVAEPEPPPVPVVPEPVAVEPEPVAVEPEPEPVEPEPVPEPVAAAEPEPGHQTTEERAALGWVPRSARRRRGGKEPVSGEWRPSGAGSRPGSAPDQGSPDRWAKGSQRRPAAVGPAASADAEWAHGAARRGNPALGSGATPHVVVRSHGRSPTGRAAAFLILVLAGAAIAAYAAGAFDNSSSDEIATTTPALTTPAPTPAPAKKPATHRKKATSKKSKENTSVTPATPVASQPTPVSQPVAQTPTTPRAPTRTAPRTPSRRQTSSGTSPSQPDSGSTRASTPSDSERRQPPPG